MFVLRVEKEAAPACGEWSLNDRVFFHRAVFRKRGAQVRLRHPCARFDLSFRSQYSVLVERAS
eukprot:5097851-Pleurochrysis_carterae.AAC.2